MRRPRVCPCMRLHVAACASWCPPQITLAVSALLSLRFPGLIESREHAALNERIGEEEEKTGGGAWEGQQLYERKSLPFDRKRLEVVGPMN